jgi:hypothetical protein
MDWSDSSRRASRSANRCSEAAPKIRRRNAAILTFLSPTLFVGNLELLMCCWSAFRLPLTHWAAGLAGQESALEARLHGAVEEVSVPPDNLSLDT